MSKLDVQFILHDYLRAFNYLIAKALKLCTFKSDILPDLCSLPNPKLFVKPQQILRKPSIIIIY